MVRCHSTCLGVQKLSLAARSITLIEAKELLGSFDGAMREYAARRLTRAGVLLRRARGLTGGLCMPTVAFEAGW